MSRPEALPIPALRAGATRVAGFVVLWALGTAGHLVPTVWLGAATAVAFVGVAHLLASRAAMGGLACIGLVRHPGWGRGLVLGLLAGAAVVGLYVLAALAAGRYEAVHFRPFAEIREAALMVLLTTAYTGLWEETLCRGYLLSALPDRLGKAELLLVSGAVFVAFHFPKFGTLPGFFLLYWFLSGVAFAVPLLATGSLWISIGLHWGHNLLYFLLLVRDGWMVAERGSGFWAGDAFALLIPALLLPAAWLVSRSGGSVHRGRPGGAAAFPEGERIRVVESAGRG